MANFFQKLFNFGDKQRENNVKDNVRNLFNEAFFQYIGGRSAEYDYNNNTYLEKGYGFNPVVYSVIDQRATKVKQIPIIVKSVKSKEGLKKYNDFKKSTKGNYSISQLAKKNILLNEATEIELAFPMEKPNIMQTWDEFFSLSEIYLPTTGNVFWYMQRPEVGLNKGVPKNIYVLPSHLIKIVLKDSTEILNAENPIKSFMLINGDQFIEFSVDEVIHIKYPNPFFDFNGGHLYGLSKIKSLLRNIESSNEALNNNVKAMKNGGAFGFISGKDVLTSDQATQLKEKLIEMDKSSDRLAKIAGTSAPVEFTRISMTTDELKPFDYLKYDQKQICNVLGWSDKLLNNDEGSKYENIKEERKRVLLDTIATDLQLFESALNERFIKLFKGYENAYCEFDYTELPEMQEDIKMMVEWLSKSPVTMNEFRQALKYDTIDSEEMNIVWIENNKKRIDDLGLTQLDINKSFEII